MPADRPIPNQPVENRSLLAPPRAGSVLALQYEDRHPERDTGRTPGEPLSKRTRGVQMSLRAKEERDDLPLANARRRTSGD